MDHKSILLATDLSARCDRPLDRGPAPRYGSRSGQ